MDTKKINKRWKLAETWWWKVTGWERLGHIKRGVSCPDLKSPLFSLDVKSSSKLPKWLSDYMTETEAHTKDGQIPIVALHAPRIDMKKGFVVMRVKDFLDLHVGRKND